MAKVVIVTLARCWKCSAVHGRVVTLGCGHHFCITCLDDQHTDWTEGCKQPCPACFRLTVPKKTDIRNLTVDMDIPAIGGLNLSQTTSRNQAPQPSAGQLQQSTQPQTQLQTLVFPEDKLAKLEGMIHKPRWVIPILRGAELEILLKAAISLSEKGLDIQSAPCQKFYREDLPVCMRRILVDEAVNGWKESLQECIYNTCKLFIDLACNKLSEGDSVMLDLLAIVLDPNTRFHEHNRRRLANIYALTVGHTYTKSHGGEPQDWLANLLNIFGKKGGFIKLGQLVMTSKSKDSPLPINMQSALKYISIVRISAQCLEELTDSTIRLYLAPVLDGIMEILAVTGERDITNVLLSVSECERLYTTIKHLKSLGERLGEGKFSVSCVEKCRLDITRRMIAAGSTRKLVALKELIELINHVSPQQSHDSASRQVQDLSAKQIVMWINESNLIEMLVRGSLLPPYHDHLGKILTFLLGEEALTTEDLDTIWSTYQEVERTNHAASLMRLEDLLHKLMIDLPPELLKHQILLIHRDTLHAANKVYIDRLIRVLARCAENCPTSSEQVLSSLLRISKEAIRCTSTVELALNLIIDVLGLSSLPNKDKLKQQWLHRVTDEFKNGEMSAVPALKLLKQICLLLGDSVHDQPQDPAVDSTSEKGVHSLPSAQDQPQDPAVDSTSEMGEHSQHSDVISLLHTRHDIVRSVIDDLSLYMQTAGDYIRAHPDVSPEEYTPDHRYSHMMQVTTRLDFLSFVVRYSIRWLSTPESVQIWDLLTTVPAFSSDRGTCAQWFSEMIEGTGDRTNSEMDIIRAFFENQVLKLEVSTLTKDDLRFGFAPFFALSNDGICGSKDGFLRNEVHLVGLDYLWSLIQDGSEAVSNNVIRLMNDLHTNFGPRLHAQRVKLQSDHLANCFDILYNSYNKLQSQRDHSDELHDVEKRKMVRVLTVVYEFIKQTAQTHILSLSRSSRGRPMTIYIRPVDGRDTAPCEEVEIWTHSNDTITSIKRQLLNNCKLVACDVTLIVIAEDDDGNKAYVHIDDPCDIAEVGIKDGMRLFGILVDVIDDSSPLSTSDSPSPAQILAENVDYIPFLMKLYDYTVSKVPLTRELMKCCDTLLYTSPPHQRTVKVIKEICTDKVLAEREGGDMRLLASVDDGKVSPASTIYNLEIIYSLMMSPQHRIPESSIDFTRSFIESGNAQCVLNLLSQSDFMLGADLRTKRAAWYAIMRIDRTVLAVSRMAGLAAEITEANPASPDKNDRLRKLPLHDPVLRQFCHDVLSDGSTSNYATVQLDQRIIPAVQKIVWKSAKGELHDRGSQTERNEASDDCGAGYHPDELVASVGLEVLGLCYTLQPAAISKIHEDKTWILFTLDTTLVCRERLVRVTALQQTQNIISLATVTSQISLFRSFYSEGMRMLQTYSSQSKQFFDLLTWLLALIQLERPLPGGGGEDILSEVISWLKTFRNKTMEGTNNLDQTMLGGYLGLAQELINPLPAEKKYGYGSKSGGAQLVKEIVDNFLWSAAKTLKEMSADEDIDRVWIQTKNGERDGAACQTKDTRTAAYKLLVTLCTGCIQNTESLYHLISTLLSHENVADKSDMEWNGTPSNLTMRKPGSFVGLENGGATGYINCILQQLYMVEEFRNMIIGLDIKLDDESSANYDENLDDVRFLKELQNTFAFLSYSKLASYKPQGLWKEFRMNGEPVNVREQHDALECYVQVLHRLDDAMRCIGVNNEFADHVFLGTLADQKICQGPRHRYSQEHPFDFLSVEVINHRSLTDSLEEFVRGDLLTGCNAYDCEDCGMRVDTIKRMCIQKLPKILTIQLKRFDYDWTLDRPVKIADYFEFNSDLLDMEPYTAGSLAKAEGDVNVDMEESANEKTDQSMMYRLKGAVIHDGNARGCQFYSLIKQTQQDGSNGWYKFNDCEITKCKYQEDRLLLTECFGGVTDTMTGRSKTAYILYYERISHSEVIEGDNPVPPPEIGADKPDPPRALKREIMRENLRLMSDMILQSDEYQQFRKNMLSCKISNKPPISK